MNGLLEVENVVDDDVGARMAECLDVGREPGRPTHTGRKVEFGARCQTTEDPESRHPGVALSRLPRQHRHPVQKVFRARPPVASDAAPLEITPIPIPVPSTPWTAAHRSHLPAGAASGPPGFRVPPNLPHTHPGSGPELLPYGRVLRPRLPRKGTASRCLRLLGLNRLNQQGDNSESPEQSTPSGAGA